MCSPFEYYIDRKKVREMLLHLIFVLQVKRHNLQRPIKPVYHSPPINAFSLKDLQKNV